MLKPLLIVSTLLLSTLSGQQPAANSAIPAEAAKMVNPVKPTADSQAHAKKMYGYECAMCHGTNGNGKGDVVADLKLTLKDYTDPAALKDLTDGEIFYIIKNGKGQMPGEGDRAKPDDLWNLVILLRSFSKKDASVTAAGGLTVGLSEGRR
jgi:mono/diheme cytochrome c family protein